MSDTKKKQILLAVLYLVLIACFVSAGLYFRSHPLRFGSGKEENGAAVVTGTYEPYEPSLTQSLSAKTEEMEFPTEVSPAMSRFYTTKRASVFTFSGLSSEDELNGVLNALAKTDSRATFFVTAEELEKYPELIRRIREDGHSLGILVRPREKADAQKLLDELREQAEELRSRYGVYEEIFISPASGTADAVLLQAASAGGFSVLTRMKEGVPESVSRMTSADQVMSEIFRENDGALQRGEIMHFQMGLFQYSDTVLGELVETVIREKCVYPVLSAAEVAEDTESLYTYPLQDNMILADVKDKIYPGHLDGMTREEQFDVIRNGYIGINWVISKLTLPGFSDAEIAKMDKSGVISNDENDVFLTFDDWGTDATIDKLLNVLEKHHATATFFVRTEHVPNNPNLLRAIAEAGHTIGDHTHTHFPLSNAETDIRFSDLSEEQKEALQQDLVTSYQTMQNIIGDMTDADGKPSLSLLFRPPTLAVGWSGLETVFDCGFTHSVSGYYTTADYNAKSAKDLALLIKKVCVPGAVIVMHFSDNADYTADALDILLTEFENNGQDFRFVGLNKVL